MYSEPVESVNLRQLTAVTTNAVVITKMHHICCIVNDPWSDLGEPVVANRVKNINENVHTPVARPINWLIGLVSHLFLPNRFSIGEIPKTIEIRHNYGHLTAIWCALPSEETDGRMDLYAHAVPFVYFCESN